VGPWRSWERV